MSKSPRVRVTSGSHTVANDALLVQLVRGALGKDERTRYLPRSNVSSRKLVVTLHGCVRGLEERHVIEEVVRQVLGVRGVVNRIQVSPPFGDR